MKLMLKDRVIAISKTNEFGGNMVALDDVEFYLLPFGLFDKDTRTCSIFKFAEWAKKRCFPPERFGADEILESLGLDYYDRWEIIKKTKAEFTGMDFFWIDFEESESKTNGD